jgi:SAM-dependent methyltransferase
MVNSVAAERLSDSEWLPPWTRLEHEARFQFTAAQVSGKYVIDCACGAGIGSNIFALNGAVMVEGIDSSPAAVLAAQQAFGLPNLRFRVGDATALPFADNSADLYISLESIEHVENDDGFVSEAFRVLKPGGMLICSTPNREVTNPGLPLTGKPWNPYHVREYTLAELTSKLSGYFAIQQVFGQNPNYPWRISLLRNLARLTGLRLPVRLNQLCKLRWLLRDSLSTHRVQPLAGNRIFEYFLVCCQKPAPTRKNSPNNCTALESNQQPSD